MHDCKTETIKAFLETTLSEEEKLKFIKAYLLGWANEKQMQALIVCCAKAET